MNTKDTFFFSISAEKKRVFFNFMLSLILMHNRYIKILLLFLSTYATTAQNIKGVNREIQKIDSLLEYNQPILAEKKADSLYNLLIEFDEPIFKEQLLKIRFQKGIAIDKKNEYLKALPIYLEVLSMAEKGDFHKIICEANIYISLIHEKNDDWVYAYTYIKSAFEQCKRFNIEELYSTIMIRWASIHRVIIRNPNGITSTQTQRLAKLGFKASIDSTMQFAQKALPYAIKYNRIRDENDCYFLIGACYGYQNNHKKSIEYLLKIIPNDKKIQDFEGVFLSFSNVSKKYLQINNPSNALRYIDSAYKYYHVINLPEKFIIFLQKSDIHKALNQTDSAYHYLQIAYNEMAENSRKQKNIEINKLEKQFQIEKKEETIKNKNEIILLFISLLIVIAVAGLLVISKNRQINSQNIVIHQQVFDLKKTIEQKEILLSELQHRVKNNLQYVISILEIQKESINYSNIDDLIKNNQNRIHSIALLHKKLNVSESVNEVDLKRYVTDLAVLVKDSYENKLINVSMFITCEIETFPIHKALPLGLIIVELVSNSMKHAFKNQQNGIINIEISNDTISQKKCLHYIDNGQGFDFINVETKGLGVEIMKGLIDQLNGKIETQLKKGFELKIYF